MGLIKEVKTDYGLTADYWKVGMFTVDTNLKEANFSLNLYAYKGAEKPIDNYCVSDLMGCEDKTLYNKYFAEDEGVNYKDWQTACYMYAKECVPFFADAVDDEEELAKALTKNS